MPYARTPYYGDPANRTYSVLGVAQGTLRFYDEHRDSSAGIGYAALFDTSYRVAPPQTQKTSLGGIRVELQHFFALAPRRDVRLELGIVPYAHGTLTTTLPFPHGTLYDPEQGSQIDALLAYEARTGGRASFSYGVRYLNQTVVFATSQAPVERNAGFLPFVQFTYRLSR